MWPQKFGDNEGNPFVDEKNEEAYKLRSYVRSLEEAFNKLKKAVAGTLYGAKKVVQLSLLIAAFKWFGLWPTAILFAALLLIEVIQMGYEKILEVKPAKD